VTSNLDGGFLFPLALSFVPPKSYVRGSDTTFTLFWSFGFVVRFPCTLLTAGRGFLFFYFLPDFSPVACQLSSFFLQKSISVRFFQTGAQPFPQPTYESFFLSCFFCSRGILSYEIFFSFSSFFFFCWTPTFFNSLWVTC